MRRRSALAAATLSLGLTAPAALAGPWAQASSAGVCGLALAGEPQVELIHHRAELEQDGEDHARVVMTAVVVNRAGPRQVPMGWVEVVFPRELDGEAPPTPQWQEVELAVGSRVVPVTPAPLELTDGLMACGDPPAPWSRRHARAFAWRARVALPAQARTTVRLRARVPFLRDDWPGGDGGVLRSPRVLSVHLDPALRWAGPAMGGAAFTFRAATGHPPDRLAVDGPGGWENGTWRWQADDLLLTQAPRFTVRRAVASDLRR